jgi:iron complex outermembrane receptor protein
MTFYATYAEGTNPGQFNAGLLGRTQGELDQIAAAGGGGIEVNEEEITNIEFGLKGLLWDNRLQFSVAVYFADWDNVIAPEIIAIVNAAGQPENIQVNSTGGQADLSGLELEGTVLLSENLTLDGTFAFNKSEINDFESPDALNLLGERTIDGMGNAFSRYPETSGSLSLTYQGQLNSGRDWFARGDLIYRGSTWMTNANITETPAFTSFNVRLGTEMDTWRIELYGTNVFNEKGYMNLQLFPDLSGLSTNLNRMMMAGLFPRPSYGIRTTFEF